jgi:hypothetical protein
MLLGALAYENRIGLLPLRHLLRLLSLDLCRQITFMYLIYVAVPQNNGSVPSIETRSRIFLDEALEAFKMFIFA